MPSARINGLFGIHTMPPDSPVDPPTRACFSTINGSSPESSTASAATIPPPPLPTMRRSTDLSHVVMLRPLFGVLLGELSGLGHDAGHDALAEFEVGDRHVDGGVGALDRGHEPVVRQPGEKTVYYAFEVR